METPFQDIVEAVPMAVLTNLKKEVLRREFLAEADQASLEPYATIPKRVVHDGNIKVAMSSISGAGRGIFVTQDIPIGTVLFKIPNILLLAVETGEEALKNTCDYCFATVHRSGCATVSEDIKHQVCTHCEILYYCNKTCQDAAWDLYHKHECSILKTFYGGVDRDGDKILWVANVRLILRILQLQAAGQISAEDWAEYSGLSRNISWLQYSKFYEGNDQTSQLFSKCTATKLSVNEISKLMLAIKVNAFDMTIPLLRSFGEAYKIQPPFSANGGSAIDPFAALINHSCVPNVKWVFEGRELRIITTEDIRTNTEIFMTYVTNLKLPDYYARRNTLMEGWSIDCKCKSCLAGPPTHQEWEEAIRKKVSGFMHGNQPLTVELLHDIHHAVGKFAERGITLNKFPMRWIIHCFWSVEFLQGAKEDALKLTLQLRYVIEIDYPSIDMEERSDTLYHLINQLMQLGPVGRLKQSHMDIIIQRLRSIRSKTIKLAFGADTRLARLDFEAEETDPTKLKAYVVSMNILLCWAGVGTLTEEQLLEM